MGEIRDRITWPDDREYDEHALGSEWAAGNLIPADEVQARIDAAVEAERERCIKLAGDVSVASISALAAAIREGKG